MFVPEKRSDTVVNKRSISSEFEASGDKQKIVYHPGQTRGRFGSSHRLDRLRLCTQRLFGRVLAVVRLSTLSFRSWSVRL